jgi:hypothetical protein
VRRSRRQDQDLGFFEEGPGNGQALLLAPREHGAALTDLGPKPLGQLLDEFQRFGGFKGGEDLIDRGLRFGEQAMARQVRDSRLETREAQARLKTRDEPYWRLIHEGLHLGYRKRVRGGVWMVHVYRDGKYTKKVLGRADDNEDANGDTVLSFKEAQLKALAIELERRPNALCLHGG